MLWLGYQGDQHIGVSLFRRIWVLIAWKSGSELLLDQKLKGGSDLAGLYSCLPRARQSVLALLKR